MAQSNFLRDYLPYPTACSKREIRPIVLRNRQSEVVARPFWKPGGQFQITITYKMEARTRGG